MTDYALTDIKAYEIIDNRGMPTIRVAACVDDHHWGRADVPCGSSTGSYEAVEIRDGDTYVNGAKILATVDAANGVVHVVDKVFLIAAN